MRGTVIQLASGELKRVEELNTEDFVRSANLSSALKMDSSTVVRLEEKTKDIVLLCFSVGENKVQVSQTYPSVELLSPLSSMRTSCR